MRALITALVAVMTLASVASASDLFLVGGRIFTADPQQPEAEGVAIRDGRILAVGSSDEISKLAAKSPDARIIDLGGRRVVPGLTESHGHAAPNLQGRTAEMVGLPWPGPSPEQALTAVKAAAARGPGWIDGEIGPLVVNDSRNWRKALDEAAPNNPVMLRPWWGHGMLLNSVALSTLGVEEDVADPLGGWYGRDADGRLDGRVRETPEWALMRQRAAGIDQSTTAAAYREVSKLYAGWGVTAYHHMMHNQSLDAGLAALTAARPVIKWTAYGWAAPQSAPSDAWQMFAGLDADQGPLRIGGIKWVLDATPIERDAQLSAPYADRAGWRGRPNYSDAQLADLLRATLANPQQAAFHVAGDETLRRLMTQMEAIAPADTWARRRPRLEHADGLTPDLVDQARRLGLVVVVNPLHLDPMPDATGLPMMQARLGSRAHQFQPMKRVADAGIPLAIGSDAGGPAANPFLNMMLAIQNPSNAPESLSREQVLVAYTRGGAYAEGKEDQRGVLKPGLAADLAVLSQDILTAPLPALPATRSLLTLVDGNPVHAEGEFAELSK